MAGFKLSKKALKRRRQQLKRQYQQSIMNNEIANQHPKVPIENQLQEIIVIDEIVPEPTAIDDQTNSQSSMRM